MNTRNTFLKTIISMLIGGFFIGFSFCVNASELTFADSFPLKHYLSKEGMVWWMNRTTELSNGSVKFRHFPAGQLSKADKILVKVSDGAVNAGYVGIGYVTDRLPLTGVSMLPGMNSDPIKASNAFWNIVSKGSLRAEFDKNKVIPLFAVMLPGYQLALNAKPVVKMDDVKGLKIRTSGVMNLTAKSLRATPVSMTAPDIYLGIKRGTLNGTLLPGISLKPYNLQDTITSFSTNGLFGSFAVTAVMNKKIFKKLNKAEQIAVTQAGMDTVKHLSEWMKKSEGNAIREFSALGIKTYMIPDGLLAEMENATKSVQTEWAERMERRGLKGNAVLKEYKALFK